MKATGSSDKKNIPQRVKGWLGQLKEGGKLWLQRNIVLAALGFVGLNALDGYLTNHVVNSSMLKTIEANPFMQPFVGHWAFSFKGVLGLGAIALLGRVRRFSPRVIFWLIMLGCFLFVGVIFWNLHTMGWLRW